MSEDFQNLMEEARQRLGTMETLQKITKENLTDQIIVMENMMSAEMDRWEKRAPLLKNDGCMWIFGMVNVGELIM